MFPNVIPESFSLGKTKNTYLLQHALGPYFYDKMLADIDSLFFSLQYDETTNSEDVKEMPIMIKYWSKSAGCVMTCHLETFFIGPASAEIIKGHIVSAVNNAKLSLSNIIVLGSNSPNVNEFNLTLSFTFSGGSRP